MEIYFINLLNVKKGLTVDSSDRYSGLPEDLETTLSEPRPR